MVKKISIFATAALFALTLFAPLSMAASSKHQDYSGHAKSGYDSSYGRDKDRGFYPKKSEDRDFNSFRYDRRYGDIGAATQPSHRGQEGGR